MLDVFTPLEPEMAAGVLGDTAYDAQRGRPAQRPAMVWMVIAPSLRSDPEFKEVHPGGAKFTASVDGWNESVRKGRAPP